MTTSQQEKSGIPGEWNPREVVDLLLEAGRRAASLRKGLRSELKSDTSLVTAADREIESLLASRFDHPDRGSYLIGEETVAQKGEDYIRAALEGTAFVVDPIDGTAPYAHQLPNWGISIGRMHRGKLTDGAVYLPDYRLLVASDGPRVMEGTRDEGSELWSWRELSPPEVEAGPRGIIAITQEMIKHGGLKIPNPVQALGAAVVPLVGILLGRFLAYAGSVRLWDFAGSLPLLHRLNFSVTHLRDLPGTPVGLEVGPVNYLLDPKDSYRWGIRGGLLACPPSEEEWIRKVLGV